MSEVTQGAFNRFNTIAEASHRPSAPRAQTFNSAGADADLKECEAAIKKGSKSFYLASMILPAETRKAALSLYAFCRHSDDLIDDPRSDQSGLTQLRDRLELAYRGAPAPYACDRAFARTVETFGIPKCIPDALLDGFAMDLANRRYRTIDEVKEYATCVAATVGLMMSLVMRTGSPDALARAADLGIAMQLTNIARDIGEDARSGRLYLPEDWLSDAGIDPRMFLSKPCFSPELSQVVQRLLSEAAYHYRRGHAGIPALPQNCRHAIRTAAFVYEEIGTEVVANGYDSVSHRAHTTKVKKLALLVKARLAKNIEEAPGEALFSRPPDPACARLVAAGAEAFAAQTTQVRHSIEPAPDDTSLERFLTIMIKLQNDTRQHHRLQRTALQQGVHTRA